MMVKKPEKTERNDNYLPHYRETARAEINRMFDGLTTNLLARYPQVETVSWPQQKAEADAFIKAGKAATLELAPLLAKISLYEHGGSDEPSTLQQVRKRALSIIANNDVYIEATAFVIGARIRRFRELEDQNSIDDIARLTHDIQQEIEEVRGALAL